MISFELYSPYFLKIIFESRKDSGSLNDCLLSVDGTDVRIPQQGPAIPGNPFFCSSLKGNADCGMRLGWIFLQGILCGLMDRMLLVSIQTSNFFAVAWRIG
jgi:hypothetical protein